MPFPINIAVDGITVGAILGLVVREVYKTKRENRNGSNGKAISDAVGQIKTDVAVIKTEVLGFKEKFRQQIEYQNATNSRFDEEVKSLNDKVFDIARKLGG